METEELEAEGEQKKKVGHDTKYRHVDDKIEYQSVS